MRPLRLLRVLVLSLLVVGPWQAAPSARPSALLQEPSEQALESPRATMFTFLEAIHRVREGELEEWSTVLGCFDLAGAGVAPESEAAREAARDLWGALNHIRLITDEQLPDAEEIGAEDRFLYFPRPFEEEDERLASLAGLDDERIELQRGTDGLWRFSAATALSADRLYEALLPLGRKVDVDEGAVTRAPTLRRWMPGALTDVELLGIEAWQWLGLLALAFLGVAFDHLVRRLLRAGVWLLLRRHQGVVQDKTVTRFVLPAGLLAAGLTWLLLLRSLGLPSQAEEILLTAARTFTILAGTWAAWRASDLVSDALMHAAQRSESRFDDVLVPLLRKTFKIVAAAFGLIYAAQSLHIDVVPLITGLGIGGLAFAFAAKDTIENFFGSVAVILDRPFEVGDWVVIGDVEGTVEQLGFRSTRVRTFYNSQVTVPNSSLVRATVDNYGRRRYRRWKTTVGVQYDTSPDRLIAFAEGIRELVRTHPYTRKDYYQVWCNGFGPSSIDILLYIFHEVPDWSTELRERERMLIDIVRLADRLGVQFAFPTQTLHVFQEEHAQPRPQHEPPGATADRRAMVHGLRAAHDIVADQPWKERKPEGVVYTAGPTALADLDDQDFMEATEDTRAK